MIPENNPFRPTCSGEDYRLADVPRDDFGNVLWRGASQKEYELYLGWLADYLYAKRDLNLLSKEHLYRQRPRAQLDLELWSKRDSSASSNREAEAGGLGMHAAYYEDALLELDIAIVTVLGDRLDFEAADLERILNEPAELGEPEATEEFTPTRLPDDYTREDVAERIREKRQARELGGLADDFCDIPWRVPLAMLLRDVPEKEQRIHCLREFFICYNDESRK